MIILDVFKWSLSYSPGVKLKLTAKLQRIRPEISSSFIAVKHLGYAAVYSPFTASPYSLAHPISGSIGHSWSQRFHKSPRKLWVRFNLPQNIYYRETILCLSPRRPSGASKKYDISSGIAQGSCRHPLLSLLSFRYICYHWVTLSENR